MAKPDAVTYSREVRDSSDAISQEKPLVISDKIWLNDPNDTQLLGWILQQEVYNDTDNHVFGHLEDAPFPMWVIHTGATETAQLTDNLTIQGVMARCAAGSRLFNPDTGEIIRLTLDPDAANTTQAVARNFGRGTSTCYLKQGQPLLILTPAMYEGFEVGKGMTNARVWKAFCTGIIDYPVKITGTENAEKARGGNPFEVALNKSWGLAKKQMEAELLFGAEEQDSSTYAYNMHTTGGLYDFIQTNVWAVSNGVITRFDFHDIIGEWRLFNKSGGAIVCSGAFKDLVVEWAYNKVQYNQDTKVDGMDITQVLIHGTHYNLIECDLFNNEANLQGMVLLLPYGKYEYRPLIHYEDRDIKYLPIKQDEKDQKQGHIMGEYGWEFFEEETFGMITGLEF